MPGKSFTSDHFPSTGLPLSPAVLGAGGAVYLSGQVGQDPATGKLAEGVAAQTEQALRNLQAVLAAAGKTLDDVVRVGVYLADLRGDFAAMNEVYARWFDAPYPARTTIGVAALPLGAAVEIDLVAR
ncbi:MAG: RidA family protein [Longimicrobiaceae bacterium]